MRFRSFAFALFRLFCAAWVALPLERRRAISVAALLESVKCCFALFRLFCAVLNCFALFYALLHCFLTNCFCSFFDTSVRGSRFCACLLELSRFCVLFFCSENTFLVFLLELLGQALIVYTSILQTLQTFLLARLVRVVFDKIL